MMTVVKDCMELNKDLHDIIVEELYRIKDDENGVGTMIKHYLDLFGQKNSDIATNQVRYPSYPYSNASYWVV